MKQNGDAVPLAKSRLARLLYKMIVEERKGDGLPNVCVALISKSGKFVDTRWLDTIINDEKEAVWDFSVLCYLPGILKLTIEDAILFFEKLAVIIPAAENRCQVIIERCRAKISEQREKRAAAVGAGDISRSHNELISPSANKPEDPQESSTANLLLVFGEARDERLKQRKEFADFLERHCQRVGLSSRELSGYCCGYSEYLTKLENSFFLTFTLFEAVEIVKKLQLLQNRCDFAEFFRLGLLGEVFSSRAVKKLYFCFTGQQLDNGLGKDEILDFINREEAAMEEGKKIEFFKQLEIVIDMVTFGRFFKGLRENSGSQREVAQRTNVSMLTLSNLENGLIANPRQGTLQKIFLGLGFSPEDFEKIWARIKLIQTEKPGFPPPPFLEAPGGQGVLGEPKAPEGLKPPEESDALGKPLTVGSDISFSAKTVLRAFLLNIGRRGLSGTPTMSEMEAYLAKAGLGQENINTGEIRLAELRELCTKLPLDDGEKSTIANLLGLAQKDYVTTIPGGDTSLLGNVLFG